MDGLHAILAIVIFLVFTGLLGILCVKLFYRNEVCYRITMDQSDTASFNKLMGIFADIKPLGATYDDSGEVVIIEAKFDRKHAEEFYKRASHNNNIEYMEVK